MNRNERAYELLRWQSLLEPSPYDEAVDYEAVQKQRSDTALDRWDQDHPYESSDELQAFRYLERLGIFNQSDFYSPSKAKDGYYTKRLNEQQLRTRRNGRGNAQPYRNAPSPRYRRR